MSGGLKKVLVLGSTGTQGGAVTRHLSKTAGFQVLAITRDTTSGKSQKLAELPNVSLVQCDVNKPADAERVFEEHGEIHGVFSVQTNNDLSVAGQRAEVSQGKLIVDLCKKHGVKHLIYASVANLQPAGGYDIMTKVELEEHVKQSGVNFTILRPTYFIENFFPTSKICPATATKVGYFGFDVKNQTKQQFILIDDMGMIAARVFAGGERWFGETRDLAGDELTPAELVAVFSEHNSRQMSPSNGGISLWLLRLIGFFSSEAAGGEILFRFMRDTNWKADVAKLRSEFPELHTVKDALRYMNYEAPAK